MKYSIWRIIFFFLAFIGITGMIFVLSISFFFYKYNINQAISEKITDLELISNTIAGPSWTVKESYPGAIENVFRGVLKVPGTQFIRIIDEKNKMIEKSGNNEELGEKIDNPPEFKREVFTREGIFNGKPIKELSIKARDGSNLWMGISFEHIKKNIFYSAILIGIITLFLFTITSVAAYLLIRNIVMGPLSRLMSGFERLKNKDYEINLGDTRISELKNVFQSFNTMVEKVKEAELKITEELKRTKQLDKIKSEFISVAAHQLRTPLSAVKWTLKMVIDGDLGSLNSEQKTFLMQGYQTNERTIRLVNDFLNVVRIEEGRFGYEFSLIHVEDLLENVIQEFAHRIKEKNIIFKYNKPEPSLPKIKIDPAKMRLALQNLIDNAIKYTPDNGNVTISAKYSKLNIKITVEDTGIGIPKDQQKKLYSKFFRSDNAIRKQTEGSGLGLFIVKNIIEKHGGQISIKSEENQGSTFTVTLPTDKLNS